MTNQIHSYGRRVRDGGGGGTTAAVLWLMILIVFLPIALAHGVARYAGAQAEAAAIHALAENPRPGS